MNLLLTLLATSSIVSTTTVTPVIQKTQLIENTKNDHKYAEHAINGTWNTRTDSSWSWGEKKDSKEWEIGNTFFDFDIPFSRLQKESHTIVLKGKFRLHTWAKDLKFEEMTLKQISKNDEKIVYEFFQEEKTNGAAVHKVSIRKTITISKYGTIKLNSVVKAGAWTTTSQCDSENYISEFILQI